MSSASQNVTGGPNAGPALRPFLKWVGGKARLLPTILPYVPATFENYHEPFLGGGAMFFAIRDRFQGTAHLHDQNKHLASTWQMVQQDPDAVLDAMEYFHQHDSKEFYLAQRQSPPESLAGRAAWFIYLNQTSWNGLWRVNRRDQFNVPWGDRPFRGVPAKTLRQVSDALIGASITADDFRVTLEKPCEGDFVYLDPPYIRLEAAAGHWQTAKFDFYTVERFREHDLAELATMCGELTERGVDWLMSNRDTQMVRDLFPNNEIVRFTTRRSVAAQNRRDVAAPDSPEALIIGGPRR
ncbi:MAG: DNA adenine methylase [Angustibacter sp.]